jgi:transposase-like protein
MKAQYQKLIKELGGSEEEVKALLRKLVEKEILERMKEVLETIGKEERKAYQEEHEVRANGYYQRDLLTPMGAIEDLQVPRVRTGDFHPCFLEPHERHLFKLEELIYAMYAGGLSTRDISRTLEALLESKYSPQRVSSITQKALEKAEAFRKRKIEKWYPIIYVDGTFLKVRREGIVGEEVVYLVLGISEEGLKEVLTFFPASSGESAEVWKEVLADLKERGLKEPLLFIGDGLTGLPYAVKEIYPKADFQSCLLHKMRQSLAKVRKRDREALAEDMRRVAHQREKEGFQSSFKEFKETWERIYPEVVSSWERDLYYLTTYLSYPKELQPFIYTTNALERFAKEVKRRAKVIESFSQPEAEEKILLMVTEQMNESYGKRILSNWHISKPALEKMRKEKYGTEVRSEEALVEV